MIPIYLMTYYYRVFGLDCKSDIEFPALLTIPEPSTIDFEVKLAPDELLEFETAPNVVKPFTSFNEREFCYRLPEVAEYFVRDGKEIWIKNLCIDWDSILLFFYSNALAALLFQRNLIPFHVSGVLDDLGNAWLFSAPTRTGKSTTAIMLQDLGYRLFTDDTCLLSVREDGIYAIPSYPMIRAWKPTLDQQSAVSQDNAFQIRAEIEKFGVYFHDHFVTQPAPVKGIVFLEMDGDEIRIESQKPAIGMQALGNNIYRRQWIFGMKKQLLQFQSITAIAQKVPFFKAIRPKDKPSFQTFAQEIHQQIIQAHGK